MVWVRLDDHFSENPKIARVGPLAKALWVDGLAYCNRNLTDGFIPVSVAYMMSSEAIHYSPEGSEGVINRLVDAGLWEECESGFRVHDFDKYQPTRREVEAERNRLSETRARAGRRGGQRSGEVRKQTAKQTAKQTGTKAVSKRESNGEANREANGNQSRSPVPDPVNDSLQSSLRERASGGEVFDDFDDLVGDHDPGWRDRYGTMVTAIGTVSNQRMADEYEQLADEFDLEQINQAIRKCRSTNKRPWPSEMRKHLPQIQARASNEPWREPEFKLPEVVK